MHVKLVGIQPVSFINSAGDRISGTNIYTTFPTEHVEGVKAEKFYLKDGVKLPDCKLNDTIDISFNMKGKVEMVSKI